MNSISLGRIAGIPISTSPSALIILLLLTGSLAFSTVGSSGSIWVALALSVGGAVAFLGTIVAHEFGHALTARRHGIGTKEIHLWLLGGVAKLEREAPTPRAEFQVAVAGPLVNLAIGAVLAVAAYAANGPDTLSAILVWLAGTNLFIGLFNLLPAAPLDGGSILTAALWSRLGNVDTARLWSGRVGMLLGGLMVGAAAWFFLRSGNPSWLFNGAVGWFILSAARRQVKAAAQIGFLRRTSVAAVGPSGLVDVPASATVGDAARWAGTNHHNAVRVVGQGGEVRGYALPVNAAFHLGPSASWVTMGDVVVAADQVTRRWTSDAADSLFDPDGATYPIVVVHDPATGYETGVLSGSQSGAAVPKPDPWGRIVGRTPVGAK